MTKWKSGFYSEKFTPKLELGLEMAGYTEQRTADSVLDDLFISAVVLQESKNLVAFVGVDVLAVTGESVRNVRTLVEQQTGIPGPNIMIAASHSHTAPTTVEIFNTVPDFNWLKDWEAQIANTIIEAYNRLKPANVSVGEGSDDSFMFNRRLLNSDNQVEMTIDQKHGKTDLTPEGPIDPSVNVVRIDDENGKPVSVIVNYGNHLDIPTGRRYSADYPGVMTKTIQKLLGEDVGVVFLNGACGDIQHLNYFNSDDISTRGRYWDSKGEEKMNKYGTVLGCEVVKTALTMNDRLRGGSLVSYSKKISVPIRKVDEETLAWANETMNNPNSTYREKTLAKEALQVYSLEGTNVEMEIHAISIGDSAILAIPAEVFVEIGLQIKEQSPFNNTMISELSNDWVGYLPTERAFEHGGYETRVARSSKLTESADKIVIEASLKLLQELKELAADKVANK
ncbi:hypothetical protein [Oceanobacillus damuensis]|uniref:hypothetical protein n=1 Tax=Oceanobacillus damuensis TaxID=937928 RepID=UPI000831B1FA|nr:hypothetical protein [Oceanobacillus damuensis]